MYCKVENNIVQHLMQRPNWVYADTGLPVSDDYLNTQGIYIIDYENNKPQINPFYQELVENEYSKWIISTDRVKVTYTVISKTIDEKKDEIRKQIKDAFVNEFKTGTVVSSLGFTTDARRYGETHDKDNLQSLMSKGVYPIYWKDTDGNIQTLDETQANILLNEMIDKGLWIYQHKWEKEAELENLNTMEELEEFEVW